MAVLNLASASGAPTVSLNCLQLGSDFWLEAVSARYCQIVPKFLMSSSPERIASMCAVHEATHLHDRLQNLNMTKKEEEGRNGIPT